MNRKLRAIGISGSTTAILVREVEQALQGITATKLSRSHIRPRGSSGSGCSIMR
jgi:hypothetical protein